jgi:hypothetical protein
MKVYVVVEIGYEYNDEDYYRSRGGKPVKAFKNQANAVKEKKRLDKKHLKDNPFESDGDVIKEYYQVEEVELDEEHASLTYKEARQQLQAAEAACQATMQNAFKTLAAKLFADNPELESFGWKQYTPHFNDGDPCVFHACIDEPDINGEDGWGLDSGKEYRNGLTIQEREPSLAYRLQPAVAEFLRGFDEEHLQEMFDDDVRVTVYRDGTTNTDDYDHD